MNDNLVYLTTATLILAAIALIAQTVFLMGLLKSVKAVQGKLSELLPKAEAFLVSAEKTLADSRKQIADVSANANAVMATATQILDITHAQVVRVDGLVTDATGRAKVQMDRVELMLDDTLSRVQDTVISVQGNIMRPIREVNAVANGIRTALQALSKGGRPSVAQATSDEEMFI
jgi:hypothetical protein